MYQLKDMSDKLNAIYSEDLSEFLDKRGELNEIESGNRYCMICGVPIRISNIQMVIPHEDEQYEYVCESIICVEKYHEINN
jgi:hypothetical protein